MPYAGGNGQVRVTVPSKSRDSATPALTTPTTTVLVTAQRIASPCPAHGPDPAS